MTVTQEVGAHPADCMAKLNRYADELDRLSRELDAIEEKYGPIQDRYREFCDDFVVSMYERYEEGEGKWPGEDVREKLARAAMSPELRGGYDVYSTRRKRIRRRIDDLRDLIGGQQSILRALREEMAAAR